MSAVRDPDGDPPHTRTRYPVGEQAAAARQPRPLRTLGAIVAVVAALVLGLTLVNSGKEAPERDGGSSTEAEREPAADPTRPSGKKPVTGADQATGIPTGYERTEQGAESAGTNYVVALNSSDMFRNDRRLAIVDSVFAEKARSGFAKSTQQAYRQTGENIGLSEDGTPPDGMTLVFRTIPAGSTLTEYDGAAGKATVSVWNVNLFGLAGEGSTNPVAESWGTTLIDLVWQDDDWKAVDYRHKDGPAPVQGDDVASSAEEIEKAVRDFGGYTYAR